MNFRNPLRLFGATALTMLAAACADQPTAPVAPDLAGPKFAITNDGSLGNFIWHDLNANGIQDAGEPGIPNAPLTVTFSAGTFPGTAGPNGDYLLSPLPAGTYTVCVPLPAGYTGTSAAAQGGNGALDSDGSGTPNCKTVVLADGEKNLDVDFGFYKTAALGDFVWYDANSNGIQDLGEPGIDGATVTLSGPGGNQSMVTSNNGAYGFTNLMPGNYTVCVDTPTGYSAASLALQGGDTAKDSDGAGNPNCASVTINSGDNNLTIDFGFTLSRASLGDYVWLDANADGIQDPTEAGIQGITVTLAGPSGPQTTTTNALGAYGFTNLLPGSYTVCAPAPITYTTSAAGQGSDGTKDSDGTGAQNCVTVTLNPGESNPTLDFGMYKLGALGDFVWNDVNNNGVQDSGEPGINGATVTLQGTTGPAMTMVTSGNGGYLFTGLKPDAYTVCVAIPAGFSTISPNDIGASNTDSNGSGTPNCDTVVLTSGQIDLTVDFGFSIAPASLGDFVWHDANANGIQDNGEVGIKDAVVTLSGGPTSMAPVTTNATGDYAFTNLMPGTYTVCVATPAGYAISPALQGGNTTKDSNGQGAGNCTQTTLAAGDNDITLDFGFYMPVALGDFVWHDLNANGVQDQGEPGIGSATVTMTGPSGPLSTTTDATGYYQFTNLLPGSYTVCAAMPAGYTQISAATQGGDNAKDSNGAGAGNCSPAVNVPSGTTDETLDFGFYKLGSIGNYVWADANSDGKQDATEVGIVGATVTIKNLAGTYTSSQQTIAGGAYLFTSLKPDTYIVCVAVPLGYNGTSPALQGGDDTKDSNGAGTGNCSTVLLPSAKDDLTIDFGFTKAAVVLGSIGDFVWHDLNANGVQDSGEPGIGGVPMSAQLMVGGNPSGPALTTTTSSAGAYLFSGLAAGTYKVCVTTAPSGFAGVSTALQGGDVTKDSNGAGTPNCATVTIAAGATDLTIDFGYYKLASIGDFTWYDKNDNGIQNGGYEVGINGVKLTLYQNNVAITTQTSANGGKYLFSSLKPGTYTVCSTIPSGYHASAAVQGADRAIDSNGAGATNCSAPVTVASGESNLTVDFGFDCGTASPTLASVGDFVWRDTNGNGVQDTGEAGIKGVTVTLAQGSTTLKTTTTDAYGKYLFSGLNAGTYRICVGAVSGLIATGSDKGGNDVKDSDGLSTTYGNCANVTLSAGENDMTIDFGFDCAPTPASLKGYVWNDANMNGIQNSGESPISGRTVTLTIGSTTKTTTTNSSGVYSFTNLTPGSYTVCVAVPTGYAASPANQGSNEAIDSDGMGTSNCATVTLAAGEQKVDPDFGIYCKPVTGSIGSFVWNDSNMNGIQNSGESGIGGRTVTLSGAANKTTTTDSQGKYSFTGLGAGTYTVCVSAPSGYAASGADKGSDDAVDSDGKGTGNCASVTLASGQTNNNMDFGFYCANGSIGGTAWYDKDFDGIQESGEDGMGGRTVSLYQGSTLLKSTTTSSSYSSLGNYNFGSLAAGTYSVCVSVPSGYKASPANKGSYSSKDSDGTGTNNCATVTISAGGSNQTTDFGFDKKY